MRKVVIYNTAGSSKMEIESAAKTWGELKPELTSHGVAYHDMTVILGGLHTTLDSDIAVLPEGDFKLFLSPAKVKSGVIKMTRAQMYRHLRNKKANGSASVQNTIGNYTRKSNEELEKLCKKYPISVETRASSRTVTTPSRKSLVAKKASCNDLEDRIFKIEYKLGIVNSSNKSKFSKKELEDLNNEWNDIKKSLRR